MSSPMAQLSLYPKAKGSSACSGRRHVERGRVVRAGSDGSASGRTRARQAQDVGAALLAGLLGLPERAFGGDLMTFDAPPSISVPTISMPELPASVTSSLPSLPVNQIQQVLSDYPLLVPAAAVLLAVPVVGAILGGGAQGAKVAPTSAARAVEALAEDERVLLVDIRSKESVKEYGVPDLRATKKKLYTVPYTKTVKGEYAVDDEFALRFSKLPALKEESIVILLDSFGKEAPEAAKVLVKEEIPNRLFYVQGGSEGPAGWKESDLPWKEPTRFPTFDLSGLKDLGSNLDTLAEDFKKAPSLGKAGLALGGIAAGGAIIATQLETFLELAVAFAAGNYLFSLLSKPSSGATSSEIKVPTTAKEVGEDLKEVAKAVVEAGEEAEKKVEAVVEATVEAAVPQNGAGLGPTTPKEEARKWIESWREKQKQPA